MYVKVNDDNTIAEFPYDSGLLKRDNPSTSFPKYISDEMYASYNVYPVTQSPPPDYDFKTQYLQKDAAPTLSDGTWSLGWSVVNRNEAQQAEYLEGQAALMRNVRNERLAFTDWWGVSDRTMSSEEAAYRQALRDITTHPDWPHVEEDDWPVMPS